MNGNWKGGYWKEYFQDVIAPARRQAAGGSPIPRVTELTPHEEIESLEAQIADEQETIRAFGSSRVALDAGERIKRLEIELEQWQAAIYAASAETQADNVRDALNAVADIENGNYPIDLYRKTRVAFIAQVQQYNGGVK